MIEKIKANVEEIFSRLNWNEFEQGVAEIFTANEFSVKRNVRFKTRRRYEIDIVAMKGNKVFCIDCKRLGGGRYKSSELKRAIALQKERMREFKKFIKKSGLHTLKFYPLIVTLKEEDLIKFNNCFVVPVWKLNSFLVNLERYF